MKRFYARTNKNMAAHQMTRLERREYALQKLNKMNGKAVSQKREKHSSKFRSDISFEDSEALPYTPPEDHHHISKSRNYHMNIMAFLSSNRDDPAIIVTFRLFSNDRLTNLLLFCRISVLNSRNMFSRAFSIRIGLVTAPNSLKQSVGG